MIDVSCALIIQNGKVLVAQNGHEFVIPVLGENLITISSNTGKFFNVLNLLTSGSKNLKVEINSK